MLFCTKLKYFYKITSNDDEDKNINTTLQTIKSMTYISINVKAACYELTENIPKNIKTLFKIIQIGKIT